MRNPLAFLASVCACLFLLLVTSQCIDPIRSQLNGHGRSSLASHGDDETLGAEEKLPPAWEIVIARFKEDLSWINRIPDTWEVVVMNKGGLQFPMPEFRPLGQGFIQGFSVVDLENFGREADSFAQHIIRRYDSLANYTVFAQAEPFSHNKHYLRLLERQKMLSSVQVMSSIYLADTLDARVKTPKEAIENNSKHPWFRPERLSLRTLDSLYFHDRGAVDIGDIYRKFHNLTQGTNLIKHQLEIIGVRDWMEDEQEVGSFAYGAMLGVERGKIVQHPREVYENVAKLTKLHDVHMFTMERTWLMLFGGSNYEPHYEPIHW